MADRRGDILRSLATIREMFRVRALHDDIWRSELIDKITDSDIRGQSLTTMFVLPLENGIKIAYMLQTKFKVQDVRKLVSTGQLAAEDNVMFVTVDETTPANLKTLKGIFSRVQMFELAELLYNVMDHVHQPRFTVVDEREVAGIVQAYNMRNKVEMPRILTSDPVAMYLALKPGQVVRIERKSPSAGESVFWRMCVEGIMRA